MRYPVGLHRPLGAIVGILIIWGSVTAAKAQEPRPRLVVQPTVQSAPQPTEHPAGKQAGLRLGQRRTMDPNRFSGSYGYPGTGVDPLPLPGPKPYWGQALGATYYNWGYFGAHSHAQYYTHTGYYGEYSDYGSTRGY
jgi:hypothetical protein